MSDDAGGIARLGSVATLAAAEIISGGAPIAGSDGRPPVVEPGQEVCIDLKWRPLAASTLDLRGFVHLVDAQETLVVHRDQVPGPDYLAGISVAAGCSAVWMSTASRSLPLP